MVSVGRNSVKHSPVSCTRKQSPRVKIVLMHSEKCKIVSGITSPSNLPLCSVFQPKPLHFARMIVC